MKIVVTNQNTANFVTKLGKVINSPEQRLILGATALLTQPLIDLYNKKADDETRAVSVARTISKIIAGTIVGVLVRAGSIELIKAFSKAELKTINDNLQICPKSKKDIFVPIFAKLRPNIKPEEFKNEYANYVKTLGTLTASAAMVFTNFLADAPLTKYFTKILTPPIKTFIDKYFGVKTNASN